MSSPPAGSISSADLSPGTLIAGFRVERTLGRGSRSTVYEATQLSLDRRVALKVMADPAVSERVRRIEWPEHRGAVDLFGVGDSPYGPWLAMRLVPGGSLVTRRADLAPVEAALARGHAVGIVHGDVTARNVLIDERGTAYLSDFGLGGPGATPEDDRAALAQLVRERSPRPLQGRRALAAAAGLVLAAIAVAAVAVGAGGGSEQGPPPPPVSAGARPIGSDLTATGSVDTVDCEGREPSGASQACTISQRELSGRPVVVPADGTIRAWAVRGARGPLALQVLRRRGTRLTQVDRSNEVEVPGPEPHAERVDLPVRKGDRVALEVGPTAAVGVRRSGGPQPLDRWFGPVVTPSRAPERPAGTGLDQELLLRVDVAPRGRDGATAGLRGEQAERARPGWQLESAIVPLGPSEKRTAVCVVVDGAIAIDLFDQATRLARTAFPAADARGRLIALAPSRGSLRVRWRNPGGREVSRRFAVTPGALR